MCIYIYIYIYQERGERYAACARRWRTARVSDWRGRGAAVLQAPCPHKIVRARSAKYESGNLGV